MLSTSAQNASRRFLEAIAVPGDPLAYRVGAHDGLGGVVLGGHGFDVGRAEVQGDGFDLGAALGAELVEELIEGFGVAAFGRRTVPSNRRFGSGRGV